MKLCCATVESTVSLKPLKLSFDPFQNCVRLWMSVLDAIVEIVARKRSNAREPTMPQPDAGSNSEAYAVGCVEARSFKDAHTNGNNIEEMADVSHSQKLHPGSMVVVVLAEALLQAVMRVVGTTKDCEGL